MENRYKISCFKTIIIVIITLIISGIIIFNNMEDKYIIIRDSVEVIDKNNNRAFKFKYYKENNPDKIRYIEYTGNFCVNCGKPKIKKGIDSREVCSNGIYKRLYYDRQYIISGYKKDFVIWRGWLLFIYILFVCFVIIYLPFIDEPRNRIERILFFKRNKKFPKYKEEDDIKEYNRVISNLSYKDISGDIAGFPIDVVKKIIWYRIKQNKDYSIESLQHNTYYRFFDWFKSDEGWDFWYRVIDRRDYDDFFIRYPLSKEEKINAEVNNMVKRIF